MKIVPTSYTNKRPRPVSITLYSRGKLPFLPVLTFL